MNELTISPELTVRETLETYPQTQLVFTANQTACVGCSMSRFCNLKDVANFYNLQLEPLLSQIKGSVHQQKPRSKEQT